MQTFILAIIIIIFIIIIKKLNKANNTTSDVPRIYPYTKRFLLTKTEYAFYNILRNATEKNCLIICPKVRLEDFILVTDNDNRAKYRGYIKSRHVDFLICDNALNILCGIELDDKSHNTKKAQKIDEFKDNLFEAIGIPLYRVKTSSIYIDEINEILANLEAN